MSYAYWSPTNRSPGLWLGLSIAATLLCCMPLGIVGIVYASLGLSAQSRGDFADEEHKTRLARLWTLWSIWIGIGVFVIAICASAATSGGY